MSATSALKSFVITRYLTPLRYPGGKAKLAPFVKSLLTVNGLLGGHYMEPFAGGASVALSLLLDGSVEHIHINDLDYGVHAFWDSVLNNTETLCRMIRNKRVSIAEWKRQRAIYRSADQHTRLEYGFSTFFLNRTNRSGIIASASMIGGIKQSGTWKIDARYNKSDLIRRIQRIAEHRNKISLYDMDAFDFLGQVPDNIPHKSLIYIDPPYYVKGKRRLYSNFYEHADHARLASRVTELRIPWIVSYDDTNEIRGLYSRFRLQSYLLNYTALDRYAGAEVMFFSDGLSLPKQATTSRDRNQLRIQRKLYSSGIRRRSSNTKGS